MTRRTQIEVARRKERREMAEIGKARCVAVLGMLNGSAACEM
jgi:hypothetical protein